MAHGSLDLDCIQLLWSDDKTFDVQVIHHDRMFIKAMQNMSENEWLPVFSRQDMWELQLQDLHALARITHFLLNGEMISAKDFKFHGNFSQEAISFISTLFSLTAEDLQDQSYFEKLHQDKWFTSIKQDRISDLVQHSLIKECTGIYCDNQL